MSEQRYGATMRNKQQLFDGELDAIYQKFWSGPNLSKRYPAFGVKLHQIMRASLPLMEATQAAAKARAESDPVCAKLADYLASHIEEERDHDVWLLEDLQASGLSREDILGVIPSPKVAALVGAHYYWALHHHPVSLLGYLAVLEGSPPSQSFFDRVKESTGLPEEAFRTLRKHGELDPGHRDELDRFVDSLPLTPTQEHLIGVSLIHTTAALGACIRELDAECSSPA